MRFKAKLAPEQVNLLYSLIVPITKLGSSHTGSSGNDAANPFKNRNGSILYLDQDFVRISTKGRSTDTDGIQCFAELAARGGIFLEHRIESAVAKNAIVMEVDLGQLRMALQSVNERRQDSSLQSVPLEHQTTILKLAKRQQIPCLCVDAYTSSSTGSGTIQVHHTIPVRILRSTEMKYHLPPEMNLPDIQLEVAGPLKTVMDRLRSLSPTVHLSATATGELTVSLDGDGASIRTFFSKLVPRLEECKPDVTECTVKMDTKKLCACLLWQQQPASFSSALLCLVENEMLVLHVSLRPASVGFFTYYVPVHFLSSDPANE